MLSTCLLNKLITQGMRWTVETLNQGSGGAEGAKRTDVEGTSAVKGLGGQSRRGK